MFWIILFFVVVGAIAYVLSTQRNAGVAVQAEYERIKRVEPQSNLAQLGPNEFEIEYKNAERKRKSIKRKLGFMFLPIVVASAVGGLGLGFLIFGIDADDGVVFLCMAAGAAITLPFGLKMEREKLPSVIEIMRNKVA